MTNYFFIIFEKKINYMKNLILSLFLISGFTFINAQERFKVNDLAKKEAKEMATYLNLSGTIVEDMERLFAHKYRDLNKTNDPSQEARISFIIDKKIAASITPEQYGKLYKNKDLYKKLISHE